jgi:hypothetical protein
MGLLDCFMPPGGFKSTQKTGNNRSSSTPKKTSTNNKHAKLVFGGRKGATRR